MNDSIKEPGIPGILLFFLLALVCAIGPHFFYLRSHSLNPDETIWITAGEMIKHGKTPYRDIMEIKPPGLLYLYAFSVQLTPWSPLAIRWIRIFADLGTAICLFTVFRSLHRPALGLLAISLWGLAVNSYRPIDSQSAEAEPFASFFVALGVVFIVSALQRNSLRLASAWGLAAFFGVMMKQPAGVEFVAIALGGLFVAWRQNFGGARVAQFVVAAILGGLIPLAAVCGLMYHWGALERMFFFCVEFVGKVYADAGGGFPAWLSYAKRTWPFQCVGVLSLCWAFLRAIRHTGDIRLDALHLLVPLWFLGALIGAIVGSHPFDHYFLTTLPPLAVAIGLALHAVIKPEVESAATQMSPRLRFLIGFATAVILVQLASNIPGHMREHSKLAKQPDLTQLIGESVRNNTAPDDQIFVWVFFPQIYYHAQRLPACADFTAQYVSGFDPIIIDHHYSKRAQRWALDQMLAEFAEHPPKVIVDFSDVYGLAISEFPDLWKFVTENYRQVQKMPFRHPDESPSVVQIWMHK